MPRREKTHLYPFQYSTYWWFFIQLQRAWNLACSIPYASALPHRGKAIIMVRAIEWNSALSRKIMLITHRILDYY